MPEKDVLVLVHKHTRPVHTIAELKWTDEAQCLTRILVPTGLPYSYLSFIGLCRPHPCAVQHNVTTLLVYNRLRCNLNAGSCLLDHQD